MKVSAIVIAYNEEDYILDCLRSLKNQTEKANEIIVVDNNCTDDTVKIAKKIKGVRVVKEKTPGMIYARNKGFNSAKYELIVRCDADTRVPKDWIKKIKRNFRKKEIDALSGPIEFYDMPRIFMTKRLSDIYTGFETRLYKHKILIGPNMSIRKSFWKKVKGEVCLKEDQVHEDIDLSIHIAREGGKIAFDESLIVDISGRRIKHDPLSFFVEYPFRQLKTHLKHIN